MEVTAQLLSTANELYVRAEPNPTKSDRPPAFKAVGISLAVTSGAFIGTSFVLKKVGLLRANVKYNEEAGEGYGYLKNAYWWSGMTLMIIGEICNFAAYAFVDAILVTPLGALSVVITTVLSAIFLKERLSFVGKIGCFMCLVGSVVIAMNAPKESSVDTIQDMKHFVIAPGFLTYAGIIIAACTFIALWAGPRYGKKSMLVYLSICSLIGGLSVVATQGLGSAIVAQIKGIPQFNQWFIYVLLVFVILTLVTEIIFLNKALNLFNAALVTPTYYVFFTSSTIVTSVVLFRGLKGSAVSIVTVVMGFLQICAGVILLQLSKSAKDVPDAAVFAGDLDQVRTVAEQEEPESEPKADAIRGAAAIIRRLSTPRQKMEAAEARRVHEDRLKDQMEPIRENEFVKWDGLKRRKTLRRDHEPALERRKTLHPPLGMAHFPDEEEESRNNRPNTGDSEEHGGFNGGFMNSFRRRAHSTISLGSSRNRGRKNPGPKSQLHSVTLTENALPPYQTESTPSSSHPGGTMEMSHVFGLPPDLHAHGGDGASDQNHSHGVDGHGNPIRWADRVEHENVRPTSSLAPTPPPHGATRSFSFQNVFHRRKSDTQTESSHRRRPSSRLGLGSRQGTRENGNSNFDRSGTEEEQVGLVKRDSNAMLPLPDYTSEDEDWALQDKKEEKDSPASAPSLREKDESEDFDAERQQWIDSGISPQRRGPPPSARRRDDQDPGDAFI